MLDLEKVYRIAERIKNSERFDDCFTFNRIYHFDDSLVIERYNSRYHIRFKGQTLGHLSPEGSDKIMHDIIHIVIQNKKIELKNKALNLL
jgi:hypothetical protein